LALARSTEIGVADLPPALQPAALEQQTAEVSEGSTVSRTETLDEAERNYLISLLTRHEGNVSESAKQAGMSRQGLHKLLNKHGISAADYRR
jgi:transcriptional regulator of acetoin/glycerol metabolism